MHTADPISTDHEPRARTTSTNREALLDDRGEVVGEALGLIRVLRLDHHLHDGLGPGRAQQHPPLAAERQLGLVHRAAVTLADEYRTNINEPNLVENIRPTRAGATLVLRKESDHRVQKVLLRKL